MKRVNLLCDADAKQPGTVRRGWLLAGGWLAAGAWGTTALLHARNLDAEIAVRTNRLAASQQHKARAERLQQDRDELAEQVQWTHRTADGLPAISTIVVLGRVIQEKVGLTRFAISPPPEAPKGRTKSGLTSTLPPECEVRLEGIAADNIALSEMLRQLTAEPLFQEVRLVQSEGAREALAGAQRRFVVTAVVRPRTAGSSAGVP